jgi:hypothetical protein
MHLGNLKKNDCESIVSHDWVRYWRERIRFNSDSELEPNESFPI